MKRRDFLKGTAVAGSFLGAGAGMNLLSALSAAGAGPELSAVRGGTPETALRAAIDALGGIGAFVRQGQTVLIKPNATWAVSPERAANTNPFMVRELIRLCKDAGAGKVLVADNALADAAKIYAVSGIGQAVGDAGGTIIPATSEKYYQDQETGGKTIANTKVHEALLESDVYINIPVLKHHMSTNVTAALKNTMGLIWDRWILHRKGLHQGIADINAVRKPDLNIVDAWRVMMSGGPNGYGDITSEDKHTVLASRDIVLVDSAAVSTWGTDLDSVAYVRMAEKAGLGSSDLQAANIKRIRL